MIVAILTTTPDGAHLKLSNYGLRFASWPLPVSRGEDPTEAATRTLAEHGWELLEEWLGPADARWTANVRRIPEGK